MYVLIKKFNLPFLFVLLTFSILSCSKYENGPIFSLRTKKARLSGTWELRKVLFNEQEKVNFANENTGYTFEKNGNYQVTNLDNSSGFEINGTWDFVDHKELLYIDVDNVQTLFKIRRLRNGSLWLEKEFNGDNLLYKYKKN